jgi:hypothetical protein
VKRKDKGITSGGMVVMQVVGMGSIDKAVQGTGIIHRWERREICQSRQAFLRVGQEGRIW